MTPKELSVAYAIRQALNENLADMPPSTAERLASSRKIALKRKKASSGLRRLARRGLLATRHMALLNEPLSWLGRMSVALPILFVVAGLAGIFQYEQQQRIQELAEFDALVLADELPPDAYLDRGFTQYLKERAVQ